MDESRGSPGNPILVTLPNNLPKNQPIKLLIVKRNSNVSQIVIQQNPSGTTQTGAHGRVPIAVQQQTQTGTALQRPTTAAQKNIVLQPKQGSLHDGISSIGNAETLVLTGNDISNTSSSGPHDALQFDVNPSSATLQQQNVIDPGATILSQSVISHEQVVHSGTFQSDSGPSTIQSGITENQMIFQDEEFGIVYEEPVSNIVIHNNESVSDFPNPVITQTECDVNAVESTVTTVIDTQATSPSLLNSELTRDHSLLIGRSNTQFVTNSGQSAKIKKKYVMKRSTENTGIVKSNKTMVKSSWSPGGGSVILEGADGRFHCRCCQKSYTTKGMLSAHIRQMHTDKAPRYCYVYGLVVSGCTNTNVQGMALVPSIF